MDQQAASSSTPASLFAAAEPLFDSTREVLSNNSRIAVPTVVLMSIVAFLAIIGLSWVMDGKKTPSLPDDTNAASSVQLAAADVSTPRKPQKLGLTVTPAGERRSTRKSHKPDILDPSQPSR